MTRSSPPRDLVSTLRAADDALLQGARVEDARAGRDLVAALRDVDRALGEVPPPVFPARIDAVLDRASPRRRLRLVPVVAAPLIVAGVAALLVLRSPGGEALPGEGADMAVAHTPTGTGPRAPDSVAGDAVVAGASAVGPGPAPACVFDPAGVVVAGSVACAFDDRRFRATLQPGARLRPGPVPRIVGDVDVRPTAGPLTLAALDPPRGFVVADGPLHLVAREAERGGDAHLVIVAGEGRLLPGPVATVSARPLVIGELIPLAVSASPDADVPATTSMPPPTTSTISAAVATGTGTGTVGLPRPASPLAATSARPDATATPPASRDHHVDRDDVGQRLAHDVDAAPGSSTTDDLASLLIRARAAAAVGDVDRALQDVDAALARRTSARAQAVLGFERARLLARRLDIAGACAQLARLRQDADRFGYGEDVDDETARLGCH
jgi:hypothetical protein